MGDKKEEKEIKNKKNLYVPEDIARVLENDARYFEIFKKNGKINRNLFLSKILDGLIFNNSQQVADITIGKELTNSNCKERKTYEWAIKETEYNKIVLSEVIKMADSKGMDHADFIRKMLFLYCKEPIYRREQIVFWDQYNRLIEVCRAKSPIAMKYKWSDAGLHYVIPYSMAVGNEEMFNYLLCVEYYKAKQQTRAYRLNRIEEFRSYNMDNTIEDTVTKNLELMKKYAPQYSINDDVDICVRLTEEGRRNLNRVYHGRPVLYETNGDIYKFKCSQDQAFIYFRKLGKDAVIVSPEKLKKRMKDFFTKAHDAYKEESCDE